MTSTDPMNELFSETYDELRRLSKMVRSRGAPSQTTSLLHRAYIKLNSGRARVNSKDHFLRVAGRAMRQLLVDDFRRETTLKRGAGRQRVSEHQVVFKVNSHPIDLLDLDSALKELEKLDARKCELVNLRFFAGCTLQEAAAALGVSTTRAHQEWEFTKAWLYRFLK